MVPARSPQGSRSTQPTAVEFIGLPMRFSRAVATMAGPAALFGVHNDELLAELGFDAAAVPAMAETNVIGRRPLGW